MAGGKTPKNILDMSTKTTALILVRMGKGCSNCGWNECACDIHHIKHIKDGGTNDHTNLTVLCPNCHRLANNGKLLNLVTIEDQIGDEWLRHYCSDRSNFNPNGRRGNKVPTIELGI